MDHLQVDVGSTGFRHFCATNRSNVPIASDQSVAWKLYKITGSNANKWFSIADGGWFNDDRFNFMTGLSNGLGDFVIDVGDVSPFDEVGAQYVEYWAYADDADVGMPGGRMVTVTASLQTTINSSVADQTNTISDLLAGQLASITDLLENAAVTMSPEVIAALSAQLHANPKNVEISRS